jgi:pimeloyl-ACP methyl ester carboxylesterase
MVKRYKSQAGKQLLYESYDRLLAFWGTDKEELDIETRYGKTHVIVSGNKVNPPLLLFHATSDNSIMTWFVNISELVKHFYIVAVDFFGGAGKSEPNDNYPQKFDLTLWVDTILDTLKIKKINIAGVSFGGHLALAYTAKNPNRVSKIVCLANCPYLKGIKFRLLTYLLIIRAVKELFPEILNPTKENVMNILQKYAAPSSIVSSFKNKEVVKYSFLSMKYSRIALHKLTYFGDQDISVFRDKALFLIGDSDILIYHPSIIKVLNNNRLNYKIISNTGHVINHEQPELINREIIDFLLK